MNLGLAQRTPDADVLIIDDDAQILTGTFDGLEEWYPLADIFGFRLLFEDGRLQHDGGWVNELGSAGHIFRESDVRGYVGYVTASVCLIKAHVFEKVARFPEWTGYQWEDVAFCMDAWASGMKVIYIPNDAVHNETQTKKHDSEFWEKFRLNAILFSARYKEQTKKVSMRIGNTLRIPA